MRRVFVLLLLACISRITAYAYDVVIDGLSFNKLTENTVTLASVDTLYNGHLEIPENIIYAGNKMKVTSISRRALENCKKLTSVDLPSTIIEIEYRAFYNCINLQTVNLQNGVSTIGDAVFENCYGLEKLIIPNSVKSIGRDFLRDCKSIRSVSLPNQLNALSERMFLRCEMLNEIELPQSIQNIKSSAFSGCKSLQEITLPENLISIDSYAFSGAGIKTLNIPNSVKTINSSAFENCEFLSNIKLPESLLKISSSCFIGCSNLNSIILPQTITAIGDYAFEGCSSLKSIEITENVETIGKYAFADCPSLSKVTLPNSLKSIGDLCFYKSSNINVYSYIINPFKVGAFVFSSIGKDAILYVPKGTKEAYLSVGGWGNFNIIEMEDYPSSFSLKITVSGNGSASYDGTTIRSKTSTFYVDEGTSATITFNPDNGYRIKSVKVNNTDVTSNISSNKYTISNINKNTTVEVEFEAIPPTTYTLSIKATGNGSASYNGTTIRSKTSTFTVNEGTSATIMFTPDNGYRIKSVKENNTDVTSYVSNNAYVVNVISRDTNIEVEFEAIPATTYTLSINAYGNGYAYYNGETIRNSTRYYTVNEGAYVTINLIPDNGYQIKSFKENGVDMTSSVWSGQYIIYSLNSNTTIEVEFEAIPVTTYSLSIKASGNGSVSFNSTTIRSKTSTFTVNKGTSATITFVPDNGYRIRSVKVNNSDVTSSVSNNQYTINNISQNTTLEVEFAEELKTFAENGINYSVMSYNDRTVYVSNGSYGSVLEVPSKITYQNIEWTVAGIDNGALTNNPDLAAIIWNPTANFTVSVGNPNLLLYVKSASYAPATIKNVIVNNVADNITLADAASGNNFYCPQEFTAKSISYTHNYGMITGIGESRGWETIALPFDVQKITHSSKGEIVPFTNWKSGDSKKPFWLMELGTSGFVDASAIKANTPYIISMPNHTNYKNEFRLNGNITFSAQNVKVKASNNLQSTSSSDKTFHPNYAVLENTNAYALNVNNDYVSYSGGSKEGSTFVLNLRKVHPFEAYMTSTSKARQTITIQDNLTAGISEIAEIWDDKIIRVYNISGQLLMIEKNKSLDEIKQLLSAGVYIVNGKKLIVR